MKNPHFDAVALGLDRGQLGSPSPTQHRNLGVGACGRGSSGQSRRRRRPGPGGPTRIKLPITGDRGHSARFRSSENPGDLGGRCALQVGVAPHSDAQKAPQGVRGEMRPVPPIGRRQSPPRGLGDGFSASARGLQTAGQTARASCQNSRALLAVLSYRTRCIGQTRSLRTAKEQPDALPQNR